MTRRVLVHGGNSIGIPIGRVPAPVLLHRSDRAPVNAIKLRVAELPRHTALLFLC